MIDLLKYMTDTKFAPGGRGPREYDCWGLCCAIYRDWGIALPVDYPAPTECSEIEKIVKAEMDRPIFTKIERPEDPCLVALMIRPPFVSHVGVMISQTEFIHVIAHSGVNVISLGDRLWQRRIAGFYRYTGDRA